MAKKKKGEAGEGADGATEAATEDGGKKKGGLLPAIVVAVALLGGGAMAGGLIGGGGGDAAAAAPTPEPTETAPPELGVITELDSLTLNLTDDHFLKLGVAIEWSEEVAEEPPTAPVNDIVIARFGSFASDDLASVDQRNTSKEALLEDLAAVYGEDIVRIYYTEFVMQ